MKNQITFENEKYNLDNASNVEALREKTNPENIEVLGKFVSKNEMTNWLQEEDLIKRLEWTGKGVYVKWAEKFLDDWTIVKADICFDAELNNNLE